MGSSGVQVMVRSFVLGLMYASISWSSAARHSCRNLISTSARSMPPNWIPRSPQQSISAMGWPIRSGLTLHPRN